MLKNFKTITNLENLTFKLCYIDEFGIETLIDIAWNEKIFLDRCKNYNKNILLQYVPLEIKILYVFDLLNKDKEIFCFYRPNFTDKWFEYFSFTK